MCPEFVRYRVEMRWYGFPFKLSLQFDIDPFKLRDFDGELRSYLIVVKSHFNALFERYIFLLQF